MTQQNLPKTLKSLIFLSFLLHSFLSFSFVGVWSQKANPFSHLLITPLPAPIRPVQKLFIQPLHFFQLSASNTTTTCRSIWFLSFKIISLSLSQHFTRKRTYSQPTSQSNNTHDSSLNCPCFLLSTPFAHQRYTLKN